jgi:cytochrome c oxidase subunit 3
MGVRLDEPRITTEMVISLRENDGRGTGSGGPAVPADPPRNISELEPDRAATPPNAARLFTYLAMFWIVALFGTIALAMLSRWVHASDWAAIPLPLALYASSAILIGSSVATEIARRSLSAGNVTRATRAIRATAALGAVFLAAQLFSWQQLGAAQLGAAANPGRYFFYLITGAHAALLLVGLAFLGSIGLRISSSQASVRNRWTLGTLSLYWNFLTILWLLLFALLRASLS